MKRIWKTIGILGGGAVIAAIINFGVLEKEIKKIDINAQQVYVELIKSGDYSYHTYREKVNPLIILIENKINLILEGKDVQGIKGISKELRQKWYSNLVSGYKHSNGSNRFENDLNILDNLITNTNWYEFPNSQQEIKSRYEKIEIALKNLQHELSQIPEILRRHQIQDQDHIKAKLTTTQSNQIDRKIEINQLTINEAYQLVEWYRAILIEQIELWRLMNPKDANATHDAFLSFLNSINKLEFDPKKL